MIVAGGWSGRRYAVLGLARSGAATVRALVASGAQVEGWDDNPEARRSLIEQLGWSEPTVVIRFWIIAFVLALIGLSTLKLR